MTFLPLKSRPAYSAAFIATLALVVAVFWPALRGDFIFDDYPIFAENPVFNALGWHWQEWHRVWAWASGNVQRPLAMLTFAFNAALGNGAFGFKAGNLAIHLLNTCLVFALARRLLSVERPQDSDGRQGNRRQDLWAIGLALAWAIHPLQVSTVMYVVQRMEMLGFTFVLLALLSYWTARQRQMDGRTAWPWLALTAAIVMIGYGFKETVILVPGYALLMELTVLRFACASAGASRAWKMAYTAGCLAATAITCIYLVPHYSDPAYYVGRDFTAWQRELTQLRVLPMYLGWCVLPLPSHLLFYYDNFAASTDWLHPVTTLLGAVFLLALLLVAATLRPRRPLLALGIGWFFVAHALTSSPLPLELVFEHRNYPALFGVVLAMTDVLRACTAKLNPRIIAVVAVVLLLNLVSLTALRASIWGNPASLALTLAETNPGSTRAAMDLARHYMAMHESTGQTAFLVRGVRELQRASALPGNSILPEQALLLVAAEHPGMPTQHWWESMQQKLRTQPVAAETIPTLQQLASQPSADGSAIDIHQLASCYAVLVKRLPKQQILQADYAELLGSRLHDPAAAIEHWRDALALDKDKPTYARQLAAYLVEHDRPQEAMGVISSAMELQATLRTDTVLNGLKAKAKAAMASDRTTSG